MNQKIARPAKAEVGGDRDAPTLMAAEDGANRGVETVMGPGLIDYSS